ncbi:hypothetical protein MAM1_0019c01720 [Mucor ambiguus]|uniref:Uncharacterized protein n=1 Tax=Mucor ambiguus TaxID=91626 RepID=A0A0C9MKD8_9FUNG|nr:hypothetical protein MAM1_0019c01720 [Mucor ambiguus]
MSKLPFHSNDVDNPNCQRKPCPPCMQFGHMRRFHQSRPKKLKNKQALTNIIVSRSDDLPSDAQPSTNVSFGDENEGNAVDIRADDNVTANKVEAKVISGNTRGYR